MTDDAEPPADVNAAVTEEWRAETTPFERVRTVMKRTYEPQSADEIAERALTTPTTARKHLGQLADSGFVATTAAPESTATLYRRSEESLVLEQAREIRREYGRDELTVRIAELNDRIQGYREELGAESPEDVALQGDDVDHETVREWQTTRRNLVFAKVALALTEAERTVGPRGAA